MVPSWIDSQICQTRRLVRGLRSWSSKSNAYLAGGILDHALLVYVSEFFNSVDILDIALRTACVDWDTASLVRIAYWGQHSAG